jgi:sulfur carrier protein
MIPPSQPHMPPSAPAHAVGEDADGIHVTINQEMHRLRAGATLADAIERIGIRPPFAAAVNLSFVPRGQHGTHALKEGDRVELIAPITGG